MDAVDGVGGAVVEGGDVGDDGAAVDARHDDGSAAEIEEVVVELPRPALRVLQLEGGASGARRAKRRPPRAHRAPASDEDRGVAGLLDVRVKELALARQALEAAGERAVDERGAGVGGGEAVDDAADERRSEEHTSELQSHSFISYAVF